MIIREASRTLHHSKNLWNFFRHRFVNALILLQEAFILKSVVLGLVSQNILLSIKISSPEIFVPCHPPTSTLCFLSYSQVWLRRATCGRKFSSYETQFRDPGFAMKNAGV